MNDKNLILIGVTLSILLQMPYAQEPVVVGSQAIALDAYPGRYAETKIRVENNLNFTVVFVAARLEGNIQDITGLENTRISVDSGKEADLPIKFYVLHKAQVGEYNGDLVVSTGALLKKIPVKLRILSPEELFKAKMTVEPFTKTVRPGGVISVVVDVTNLRDNLTDLSGGEIEVIIDVSIVDTETGKEVGYGNQSLIVSTESSKVLKIPLPENIAKKKYLIEGKLYPLKSGKERGEIASATAEVEVVYPLLEVLTLYVQKKFEPSKIKVFLSMIPVAVIFVLAVIQYQTETERRKRYLESLDFDSLPRPGRNSGFMGRVAETTMRAFLPLDEAMNHVLVAGATGSGKTVAAQVIVEEALMKNKAAIIFDPTAQWTGFIRPCKTKGMLKLYPHFNMKKTQARAFSGNIYVVDDPHMKVDVRRHIKPSEITIFCMHNLTATQLDLFVENTVKNVFRANLDESSTCRLIIVYDEVHRLLPKFGGSGRGFVYLERAAREFRKWGVGLILISQVLSDFVGEIKANIGTEVQMRTRYEKDLKRIKLKYDKNTMRSVVKESVGTGMIQSAEYNKGRPYFVSFRPLLHHHHKLSDETLEKYGVYNKRLDEIYEILQKYKVVGSDVFDFELELNLAVENLKRGLFDVLELYLESLEPKIQEHFNTLDDNQKREFARLQEEDKLFVSRSKDAEEKIEKEIEDLSLLKKEQRNEDYWKRKLDEERKKIEEELTTEREEIAMIVDRLNKIKKIVKDKEEIKTKLDDIRRNIEGEVKNDGKSS